ASLAPQLRGGPPFLATLGPLEGLVDQRQAFRDLTGAPQRLAEIAEEHRPMKVKHDLGHCIEDPAERPRRRDDFPALEEQRAGEAAVPDVPEVLRMRAGKIAEQPEEAISRRQVPGKQGDRTRGLDERVEQRRWMIGSLRIGDALLDDLQCAIRWALQAGDASVEGLGRTPPAPDEGTPGRRRGGVT